jgi:hypothetical protein
VNAEGAPCISMARRLPQGPACSRSCATRASVSFVASAPCSSSRTCVGHTARLGEEEEEEGEEEEEELLEVAVDEGLRPCSHLFAFVSGSKAD